MQLCRPSGRPEMTLFFMVFPSRLIFWLIRFNFFLGSGSLIDTLHTTFLFMSRRWSQFFVGTNSIQFFGAKLDLICALGIWMGTRFQVFV